MLARYEALITLLPQWAQAILDVGCGDGYLLYLISCVRPHTLLCGADSDFLGVSLASEQLRKHNRALPLIRATAYRLPVQSSSFDAVLMADVIEHLDDPDLALREVCRVLRDKGALLLSTPNRQPDMEWDRLHVREYDAAELESLLKEHFLEVQVSACWPMWWIRRYRAPPIRRRLIRALCRLGYNPFLKTTSSPSAGYGQLIVKCTK